MRVAILAGSESEATIACIERVAQIEGVEVAGILLDSARTPWRRRWKNLRRNLRREGWGYPLHRVVSAIEQWTERLATGIVPRAEVDSLLRRAFPERCFRFADLTRRFGIPVYAAGNLNSPGAARKLEELDVDLGIVLGTRVLKRGTFGKPRLGCINLHKGAVPDFRGMPPGFWELWDGVEAAGVTVHFVDDGLDTGDILAASRIPIQERETPQSLAAKLNAESLRVLPEAVKRLRDGDLAGTPQPKSNARPRTLPTRKQRRELYRRLGIRQESDAAQILKNSLYLFLYYSGIHRLCRWMERRPGGRAAIVLYHRVNDYSDDPLTVNTRRLAEHLLILKKWYRPTRTKEIVDALEGGNGLLPDMVAIHFDDCYQDVYTTGRKLLEAAGIPACFFISSGYLDTDRKFEHDRKQYPHDYPNLSSAELRDWAADGFEVGAHTVNHADLGTVKGEAAREEIVESGRALKKILGEPVEFFSYPFGKPSNITEETRGYVRDAGYRALFSAYGGFVTRDTDRFDIPRFGVSGRHLPLRFLMDLAGLTPDDLRRRLRRN